MASTLPIFSGETKVAVMRRVLRDGTVEIYSDSASKAQTDPDHCIDLCTAEECFETYGIEVEAPKPSKTTSPSLIPICTRNGRFFGDIHYHATSHIEYPSPFWAATAAAAAAAADIRRRHGRYPSAIVVNPTPFDDQHTVHAAMMSPERPPRSDFTPAEQADWEQHEWMAMQEDEYERETPLPSQTYRSRNLSPEADARSVESDRESIGSFDAVHGSRRGSFTSDDFPTSLRDERDQDDRRRRLLEDEQRRLRDARAREFANGFNARMHYHRPSPIANDERSARRYSVGSDRESVGSFDAVHGSRRGSVASTDYYTCHSDDEV